jgi:hypothetical protein
LIQLFGCLIVTCNGDNRDVVLEGGFLSVYYSRCFFLSPQLLLGFEELRLHVSRDILLTKSACAVLVWGVRSIASLGTCPMVHLPVPVPVDYRS